MAYCVSGVVLYLESTVYREINALLYFCEMTVHRGFAKNIFCELPHSISHMYIIVSQASRRAHMCMIL